MSANARRTALLALSIGFAFAGSGCSLIFVEKVPDPILAPNYPVTCTESRWAPILDTVCSAGQLLAAANAVRSIEEEPIAAVAAAEGIAWGTLCALSAYAGFRHTSRCGEVKPLNAMCVAGDVNACTALRPGRTPGPAFTFPPVPLPGGPTAK